MVFFDPVFAECRTSGTCGVQYDACSGYWCGSGTVRDCRQGCYCTGGWSAVVPAGVDTMCMNGSLTQAGIDYTGTLNGIGVYLCPAGYTSGERAKTVNDCYHKNTTCSGGSRLYYARPRCYSGQYLPAQASSCSSCPAGKYCDVYNGDYVVSSCNDQGITGSCTGNQYSTSGAQACSLCNGVGRAVKKNNAGTLNVGCDVCDEGTYANDGHTACEICEAGYACTNGMKTQCTGNQYSNTEGASQCTECTGNGKAVVKNNGLNVGCDVCPPGTYANDDHSQCIVCPAGYACSNGFKNDDLCPPGTCAANANGICVSSGGVQCKTCSEINSSKPYSVSTRTQCVECNEAEKYYDEDYECQNCPNVEYNHTLYTRVRIDGQSGKAMCGIKLNTSSSNTPSLCSVESLVQWHIVNDAWKLVEEFSVKADMTHYVKDPSPTSPDGSDADADWCGTCPDGKFNIYANRTGESACVACPVGYCTSGNSCLKCRAGYYCPGTNGVANSCSGGTVVVDGERYGIEQTEEEEYKCKKGSFSASGQSRCTNCASGYTTNIEGKPYYPDNDDLNEICQKIKIRLMFNNNQWKELPDIFKNVKMNASVLQPQQ